MILPAVRIRGNDVQAGGERPEAVTMSGGGGRKEAGGRRRETEDETSGIKRGER